jgi:hypothetical protein
MTAILLNDGEIAARLPGKWFPVFQRRGIAFKTRDGAGKNKFVRIKGRNLCPIAACQILIIRGFFAFAKIFQQTLDTSARALL